MDPDELHDFERTLADGRRLIAIASGELEEQANGLLEKLAALDAKGPRLADGSTIQIGWSRLTIHQRGAASLLHVHEPDFLHDPQHATVAHVDRTLRVLRDGAAILQLADEAPREFYFWQNIMCERGALLGEHLYFERQEPTGAHDSGWFAGNASAAARAEQAELKPADLVTLPLYRLLVDFPPALKLLALPVGYLAVFRWERLVALFRPGGDPVQLPHANANRPV
jgi:hypothetical protein